MQAQELLGVIAAVISLSSFILVALCHFPVKGSFPWAGLDSDVMMHILWKAVFEEDMYKFAA